VSFVISHAVGNGDMFSIQHNSDNFTIIDCCISDDNREWIMRELNRQSEGKGIQRFISTHPDQDHIMGLEYLDDTRKILNFYCVKNKATKDEETNDFKRYFELRDHDKKAFYLYKGCSRKWMNESDEERTTAGINIYWPVLDNLDFKSALQEAADGKSPNNISPVITYAVKNGEFSHGARGSLVVGAGQTKSAAPELIQMPRSRHGLREPFRMMRRSMARFSSADEVF